MAETTKELQRPAHLWGPGQSGNPAGRPKGSRNKLAESFIADLYDDWQQRGKDVIARCAQEKPDVYLKVVAGLLPKDVNLKVTQLEDLSDEQLLRKLNTLTEMARPLLAKIGDTAVGADVRAETIIDAEYTDTSST
jgi:Family of unknown function (DUF5681)